MKTAILIISIISSISALDPLSPAFLVQRGIVIENLHNYPIGVNSVTFLVNYNDSNYEKIISNISETHIPVVVEADESVIPYNLSNYFSELKTKNFGRNLIVADNIPTTMDLGHDFGNIQGLVFIANKQTRGRGSNQTAWESPRGDVYLNINLNLTNEKHAGLLPIHCALSLIKAVETTKAQQYAELPIKFSWPISITWMPWNQKIGGILVEPTNTSDIHSHWYTSGCGLRVNSELEYSVSNMINEYNAKNPENPENRLEQLELPQLIARTVNYLEEYYNLLETNPEEFLNLVKEYWVNDQQKVILNVKSQIFDINEDGSIVLKDDDGFTAFLKPNPERFGFERLQVVN